MDTGNRLFAWLALHLVPGLGPVTCQKLVKYFGSPERVLAAGSRPDPAGAFRLRPESKTALWGEGRQDLENHVEKEIELAAEKNIRIIPCDDSLYPSLLKKIHDPPTVLYVKGVPESLNCRGIGMVGSRAATHYGKNVAGQLAKSLAGKGFSIISGMALGIDTASHKGALDGGANTIAVLGCGLDIIYPPSNHILYKEISAAGAVVSEYPFGTEPEYFRFPARNRIISGLSLGVVVVEAANRSGSLITANHALEQGREVFAVPGRIDSAKSAGSHTLLQQGAKLVHGINDIIEEFPASPFQQNTEERDRAVLGEEIADLSREEAEIYGFIEVYPRTFDEIALESGFSAKQINEILLHLELKGLVETLPGKTYQRATLI